MYSAVRVLMGKRNREKEEEKKEGKGSKEKRGEGKRKEKKGKRREMKKKSKMPLLVLKNFPKDFTMPRTLPEALSIKNCILIGSICTP